MSVSVPVFDHHSVIIGEVLMRQCVSDRVVSVPSGQPHPRLHTHLLLSE